MQQCVETKKGCKERKHAENKEQNTVTLLFLFMNQTPTVQRHESLRYWKRHEDFLIEDHLYRRPHSLAAVVNLALHLCLRCNPTLATRFGG